MPDTAFVQANSIASASGLGVTTFDIPLTGTTAGNNLYCAFKMTNVAPSGATVTMTDNQANTWHPSGTGGVNNLNGFYTPNPIPGGNVTATVHVTGAGASITAIAIAIMEYANTDPFNTASEFGIGNNVVDVPMGSGTVATVNGENVLWQPLTTYDVLASTGPQQVQDTGPAPAHLQLCLTVNGTSGATAPAWNHAGGDTSDGSITWNDQGVIPTGALLTLWIGYSPFVEFLSPGAGWNFRTQASNALGISIYDQIGPWIQNTTVTVTKTVDTYDLEVELETSAGQFTAPPAANVTIVGSFNATGGAGSIIGGTK